MGERQPSSQWPTALPIDVCDAFQYDIAYYGERWNNESSRLCSSASETRVKVLELGQSNYTFSDSTSFQQHIESSSFVGVRVILIPQSYSWGRLLISEGALDALMMKLQAFPPIFDMIEAFGERTAPSNESLGGAHIIQNNAGELEASFLLKHVEMHGREDSEEPWSIRQMGVYLKQSAQNGCTTFALFNPPRVLQQRLKKAQQATGQIPTAEDVMNLLVSCSTVRWRPYINYLEEQLSALKVKAHVSAVSERDRVGEKPKLAIDFGDSQDLRVINDKLLRIDHILATNLQVFKDIAEPFYQKRPDRIADRGIMPRQISFPMNELRLQSNRVASMLRQLSASSELMQNIIAARGLDALQGSSRTTYEIMRLAQSDNKLMLSFSRKAQNDARVLKTITILTMIYLPASFVSQLLSMGYITVSNRNSHVSLHFAGEMWIFAFLTVVLLLFTGGSWGYWEWRRLRRKRHPPQPEEGRMFNVAESDKM